MTFEGETVGRVFPVWVPVIGPFPAVLVPLLGIGAGARVKEP